MGSAAELAIVERRLDCLAVKRASWAKAMILLASAEDAAFGETQRERPRLFLPKPSARRSTERGPEPQLAPTSAARKMRLEGLGLEA